MIPYGWILAFLLVSTNAFGEEPPLRLYAAGSLGAVMTELAQAFTASGGPRVESTFGASGLLRERIEKGEPTNVLASADVRNAQLLADAGRAAPPIVFARNRLCALLAPGIDAKPDGLLERMLDPTIKLGTSTPRADPSGDYAWQLFEKFDKLRPRAYAILAPGIDVIAVISTASADNLNLAVGKPAHVLIKASSVLVGID